MLFNNRTYNTIDNECYIRLISLSMHDPHKRDMSTSLPRNLEQNRRRCSAGLWVVIILEHDCQIEIKFNRQSSIRKMKEKQWDEEEMFYECKRKHGFSSVISIWDAFLWIYQTMKISIKSDAVFCMLKFKLNVVCNFKQKSPAFVLI